MGKIEGVVKHSFFSSYLFLFQILDAKEEYLSSRF